MVVLLVSAGAHAQQCATTGTNQTCTNSISLSGGATGIFDNATLTATNTSSGTISGSIFGVNATDNVNVTNFGTISGGVFGINATKTGNITNYGSISGTIGISASASNVTNNLGTISGSIFGISANVATVSNSGVISGGTSGIFATTATVTNSGTILSAAGGHGINATVAAIVTNSGNISGGAFGVLATNIVDVSNSGTVSGSSSGISGGAGTVTNSGTISGATGINLGGNSEVFNSGTVIGTAGTAINFVAGSNTLMLAPGFVINGKVIGAGGDTLQLGGVGNGTFDLSLIGGAGQYEGFSAFSKVGSSTWTATGTFSQPGPWAVRGGTLIVNGALSAASGVSAESGGTLAGTGILSSTTIDSGGTLAPGQPNSIGTLRVIGNLASASAANYVVQVSPGAASLTVVSGVASIGGALTANGTGGAYTVGHKYDVLTASGGASGTFSSLSVTGSFGSTQPVVTYDTDDVYLTLVPAMLHLPTGSPTNVTNVASAVEAANTGTLPLAFQNLFNLPPQQLQNALTQLSGEAATGAQQAAFQITNEFLSLLVDPFGANRVGAEPTSAAGASDPIFLKTPSASAATASQLSVWGAAYGSTTGIDGDPEGLGSHNLTVHTSGFATGIDDRIASDTTVGFAIAGGATSWSLSAGLGGGRSDVFQAGIYGSRQLGAAYLSGALAYGSHWASTSRTVAVGSGGELDADFEGQSFSGRLEGGYHIRSSVPLNFTPYAALQAQSFSTPAYNESALGGASPFALAYDARSATGVRGEIGTWADSAFSSAGGTDFHLIGRIGWAHDWQTNPDLGAAFVGLQNASFVVNGATLPADLFLMSIGGGWRWLGGWSFLAKFDSELSGSTRVYAGTGRLRYIW
jgi:uncharacterized protein with beta-barrel porin domain